MEDKKHLYEALPGPVEPITVPAVFSNPGITYAEYERTCLFYGIF